MESKPRSWSMTQSAWASILTVTVTMPEWEVKVRRGWLEEVVGDEASKVLVGPHWASRKAGDGRDGQHRDSGHHLNSFGSSNYKQDARGGQNDISSARVSGEVKCSG